MPTDVSTLDKTALAARSVNNDDDVISLSSDEEDDEDVFTPPVDGRPITSGDMNVDAEQALEYHRYVSMY